VAIAMTTYKRFRPDCFWICGEKNSI